jgi:hypothetical protein
MKYFLSGIAFVIALAVIVLVIRNERQEMQQAVQSTVDHGIDTAIDKSPQIVERTIDSAGKAIGKVLRPRESDDDSDHRSERTSDPSNATTDPKIRKTPVDQAGEAIGKVFGQRESNDEPNDKSEKASDRSNTTADPIGLVGDLFNLGRQAARAADDVGQNIFALDLAQERETGREVHRMILKDHTILRLPEQQSRMERLAEPLLNLCKRKGLTYTFSVIDDKEVNAFSHLGAYIYVHKGLLDFAASDVELQYVIGHEIAHVELKHCLRNLTYSARMSKWTPDAAGGIAQLAYNMISLGYSEDFEFEADEWSFRSQIRLGYRPDQATSFARHYLQYLTSRGIETESRRAESVSDAVAREVENHFRSHPAARERLRRLEKLSITVDKPRN